MAEHAAIRVVVGEDQPLIREGVVRVLDNADFEVVGWPPTPRTCCARPELVAVYGRFFLKRQLTSDSLSAAFCATPMAKASLTVPAYQHHRHHAH